MSHKFVKFSNIGKHPFLREIDTLADWFEFEGVHALPVHLHLPLPPYLSLFLSRNRFENNHSLTAQIATAF